MATYDKPILTNKSTPLIEAVSSSKEQLTFTKIIYSSDDYTGKTDDDIANLTDLTNKEMIAPAESFEENHVTKIRGSGNNENIPQGFNITTYGLYAKGNNIDEMLVAVATSQSDYMSGDDDTKSRNKLTYTFNFKISNTQNINFSNIHDVSVTQSDLQSAIANIDLSEYAKKDDLNNLKETINQNIIGPDSTISQSINAMGNKANQYTNDQLKGYTNTADLNAELGGKQPLGNYASPDDVNNAENRANSHSDSNRDNLQEQINSKQQAGDYVTNEDLKNKLSQKQDAGSYLTTDDFNKYDLSVNDGKLMYGDKPLVTAIKPIGVTLSANPSGKNINYQVTVDYDGGSPITNYQIFYKKQSDDTWQSTDSLSHSGTINVDYGTYDLKVTANNEVGATSSDSVSVRVQDDRIYGASWNQSIDSTLTRTDEAVGMISGINGDRNDFDNTNIWGAMHRVTDEQGNIFIRIPKLYIKKTQTSGLSTWQISLVKHDDDWYLPKCFWDFDDNKELPYVDVGAYLAGIRVQGSVVDDSASLTSGVNTVPTTSNTINQCRRYARNNGKGYQILDIHVWDVLQVLFIIEFATLDSQSIMYGNAVNYNSAYTDHMVGSSAGDSNNMKYRGIESLYCNLFQFLDGITFNLEHLYVCDNSEDYTDSSIAYPYNSISYQLPNGSGQISLMGLDNRHPEVSMPQNTSGYNGYYGDYYSANDGYSFVCFVGGNGNAQQYGIFLPKFDYGFGYSAPNLTTRLVRKAVQ